MIERILWPGIAIDVCWHLGNPTVVEHMGSAVRVFILSPEDLQTLGGFGVADVGTGGNAAPRMDSFQETLWVVYRGHNDRGYLKRLDTDEVNDLGPVFGQRPFLLGHGMVGWQVSATQAHVASLDLSTVQSVFFASAPTGLSRLHADGSVTTWEQDRQLHPYGAGWTVSSGVAFAEGLTAGIVGEIFGVSGVFSLWAGQQVRDPRCADEGFGKFLVGGWCPGNSPAKIALVTTADLQASLPVPPPPPMQPVMAVKFTRAVWWGVMKPSPVGVMPGNCVVLDQRSNTGAFSGKLEIPQSDQLVPGSSPSFIYVGVEDFDGLVAECQRVKGLFPHAEIITYSGGLNLKFPGTIPGFQLYFGPGETINQLVTRFQTWAPSGPFALIVQAYDRNGTQKDRISDIAQLQAVAAKLVNVYPNLSHVLNFCWVRAGGVQDYGWLQAALALQATELLAFPTPQPIPPPTPSPNPSPVPPMANFPPRNETREFFETKLNPFYKDELHREPVSDVYVDSEGISVWIDVYLHHRVDGMSHQAAMDATMREVAGLPPR